MCHLSWAHKEGKNVTLQESGTSLQNELPVFEKSGSVVTNMREVVKTLGLTLALLLSCVTLDKSHNLLEPPFSHLKPAW